MVKFIAMGSTTVCIADVPRRGDDVVRGGAVNRDILVGLARRTCRRGGACLFFIHTVLGRGRGLAFSGPRAALRTLPGLSLHNLGTPRCNGKTVAPIARRTVLMLHPSAECLVRFGPLRSSVRATEQPTHRLVLPKLPCRRWRNV